MIRDLAGTMGQATVCNGRNEDFSKFPRIDATGHRLHADDPFST